MFCNKDLIDLSGISRRTYFRRLAQLKALGRFQKITLGETYTYDEARVIAKAIGFVPALEKKYKQKMIRS